MEKQTDEMKIQKNLDHKLKPYHHNNKNIKLRQFEGVVSYLTLVEI